MFPSSDPQVLPPSRPTPPRWMRRVIHFLTFVNQPIKRRFTLFYLGVLWWFLVMTALSSITFFLVRHELTASRQQIHPTIAALQHARNELSIIQTYLELLPDASAEIRMTLADRTLRAITETRQQLGQIPAPINQQIPVSVMLTDLAKIKATVVAGAADPGSISETARPDMHGMLLNALDRLHEMELLAEQSTTALSRDLTQHQDRIAEVVRISATSALVVLLVATILLTLFTYYIRKAIGRPLTSLIRQVDALVEGNADLSSRIRISSRDEIGVLTEKLNRLTEKLHELSVFKRIIEEDPRVEDVYARLGDVFGRLELNNYTIYEVKEGNCPVPVYPPDAVDRHRSVGDSEAERTICRAIKANRMITSIDFPGICSRMCKGLDQDHACIPVMLPSGLFMITQFVFGRVNPEERELVMQRLRLANEFLDASRNVLESKKLLTQLRECAIRDPLTGLYNRRFLSEIMTSIMPGVRRRKERLGIAICDIDHFKQINDTFGHQAGDSVLQETATTLNQSRRESDIVIRYGGEEFLVIFRDLDGADVKPLAERIRTRYEHMRVQVSGQDIHATISIGTSIYPDNGDDIWDIIRQADKALYQAKKEGRNRVVSYSTGEA